MKKILSVMLAALMCMALSACGQTRSIEFPFEGSDVEDIALYRCIVPADAEKKIVTAPQDIEEVIRALSEITLKDKKIEAHAGGTVTSFRFHLTDGTSYTVIYCADAVKSGTIRLTDDETTWFTAADVGGLWENWGGDAVRVTEGELPTITDKA